MTGGRSAFGALSDLKIIDLTQMLSGPYGTMMLADQGAQVIKVEPPSGDMTRASGPYRADDTERALGGYFQSINRNKESVCLDLKSDAGKSALKALVRDADAIVENFRAGVMEKLGLGYEVLHEINPRLVYGCLRGFGDQRTAASPYKDWPAFDVVAQAMGGIMAITGPNAAAPTKVGPGIGDIVPGIMLAFGVLAAIHHARRTGEGQFVDVAMIDGVLALCERMVWQHSIQGFIAGPEGNHQPFLTPFGMFPASDGYVTIAAHQDGFFDTLCKQLNSETILKDPRFSTGKARSANRQALIDAVSEATRRFSKAELKTRLGGLIPFGPVMDIAEIESDPHFALRDMIVDVEQPGADPIRIAGVPIKMTVTPGGVRRRAPLLGEDTRARLREAGLSDPEIVALLEQRHAIASRSKEEKV
jgi:crotonobetainyl-CoA:carnitine CoA-transferase CaiB-like acyl-CoA transferase